MEVWREVIGLKLGGSKRSQKRAPPEKAEFVVKIAVKNGEMVTGGRVRRHAQKTSAHASPPPFHG
jgi:hypothetical protein